MERIARVSILLGTLAFLPFRGTGEITDRAIKLLQEGKPREAVGELERITRKHPSYFPAYSLLGISYSQLGKPELAQPYLEKAVRMAPQSVEARINLSANLIALKKPAQAAAELEKVVAANPKHLSAWVNLANSRLRLNKPQAALEALKQAQALAPDDMEVRLALAETRLQMGEVAEARAVFEQLKPVANPQVQLATGLILERNGRSDEAAEYFSRCGELDGAGLLAVAEKTVNEGDYGIGLALLKALPPPFHESASWHALAGYSYFKLKEPKLALESLQKAVRLDPTNEDYYLLLAEFLGTNNAVDPVVTVLETAAKSLPTSVKIQTALGVAYLMQSRFENAEAAFQSILRARPSDDMANKLLADCYNRAKDWGKLRSASSALRALDANNPLGWYYGALAEYQLLEAGATDASIQTVRAYVKTAVKLAPSDWRSRVLEGKLALKDGRVNQAIAAFHQAKTANPEEPVPIYLLATALRQAGKSEESAAEFKAFRSAVATENARKFRTLVVEIQRQEIPTP